MTGRMTAAASVGTSPSQKYGAVFARSHSAGGSRGPLKSVGGVGTGLTARFATFVSCVIVPSFALAEPAAWQVWHVSPFSKSDVSLKIARPWATSWSFDVSDVVAATA